MVDLLGSARRADGEAPGLRFEADSGPKLPGERAQQQGFCDIFNSLN
jgi:hypothetical protein